MYYEDHAIKTFEPGTGRPAETLALCRDQDTARVIVGAVNSIPGLIAALELYQTYIGPDGGFQSPPDMKTKGMLFDKAQEAIDRYLAHSRIEPDYTTARAFAMEGKKINAIKEVRAQTGMSLREAKDLVEEWPEMRAYDEAAREA